MAALKAPLRVLVTGAAGQIAYSFIPLVASGRVFGADQPVILHLLDIPEMEKVLRGVEMEIQDCGYRLLQDVLVTVKPEEAFTNVQVAVLLGGFPRKQGMTRADLLAKNGPIFVQQGQLLDKYADRNVKVLVVANPANTNCMVAALNAPSLPKSAFSALTRLDENRARYQLAAKLRVRDITLVQNVTIWGNHSKSMVPDVSRAVIIEDGQLVPVGAVDEKWLKDEFIPTVQNRGTLVIEKRGLSSAMSAAQAAGDHLASWLLGTPKDLTASMGVWSDGSYGAPKDVIFSFPVTCKNGAYTIMKDLPLDDLRKGLLAATGEELLAEKKEAGY